MILSVIVILLLVGIASIHYVQGLFSATVSAVCAGLAAFTAFAFHEQAALLGNGFLGSYGDAVALILIFAVVYLVLRFIIDNAFPGNVRFPVALEKIGAAVMGLVAGLFATAMIALAAQMLPFSPGPIFHTRYPTEDGVISAPRRLAFAYKVDSRRQGSDQMDVFDAVTVNRIGTDEAHEVANNLWVPVDSIFLSLVGVVGGDTGSLRSGGVLFTDRYPDPADDYKDALFGRQVGVQTGAKRVAINAGAAQQVTVPEENGLFRLTTDADGQFAGGIPQTDGDERDDNSRSISGTFSPAGDKQLLVVRALFDGDAADKGGFVRFSPGSARLVAGGEQYFPIGTLESGRILVVNKPDDYLLSVAGADFVYEVDPAAFAEDGSLAGDAYFEFKELADVNLAGRSVEDRITPDPATHLVRKRLLQERIGAIFVDDPTGEYNTTDGFDQLRDTAGDAPVPEPDAEDDTAAPSDDDESDDGGGMLDNLRDGVNERNEELDG